MCEALGFILAGSLCTIIACKMLCSHLKRWLGSGQAARHLTLHSLLLLQVCFSHEILQLYSQFLWN